MRLDSFELSKIAGAFLCALLVIVGFKVALEIAEHDKAPEKPGYVLPAPEAAPAHGAAPAGGAAPRQRRHSTPLPWRRPPHPATPKPAPPSSRSARRVIRASTTAPTRWARTLRASSAAPRRATPGFSYSDAMKAKGGNWTLEDLASFIHSPKTFVPGTKMLFPGIADPGDLGDLLAYLNTVK